LGARGEGRTDDTRALQRAIDAAGPGGRVRLRSGAVYRVDTNAAPSWSEFGGLKLRRGQTLELNNAELKALPSRFGRGSVVQAYGVDGWSIVGPGRITGELDAHRGRDGEWGMGVAAFGADNWTVGPQVRIANCWGDGIYVAGREGGAPVCDGFLIDNVEISHCRRNGISVIGGRNGEIRAPYIHHIKGINPQGGIDLEPDNRAIPNRNIRIHSGRIHDTAVGIYVVIANQGVTIENMDIRSWNSGIIFSDNLDGLRIVRNPHIECTTGGEEGAAIRTVTGRPDRVRNVLISENVLVGGGLYVLDIFGEQYVNLVITKNRITAIHPRTRGIARVGGALMTDNVGSIERGSGFPENYLFIFDNVRHGNNRFRNLSPHRLPPNARNGSRDIGGNVYTP
jgi:hypothetical protein